MDEKQVINRRTITDNEKLFWLADEARQLSIYPDWANVSGYVGYAAVLKSDHEFYRKFRIFFDG